MEILEIEISCQHGTVLIESSPAALVDIPAADVEMDPSCVIRGGEKAKSDPVSRRITPIIPCYATLQLIR